jgi:hypothetical protein
MSTKDDKFMVQLCHKGDLERNFQGSFSLIDNNMIILKKVVEGEDHMSIPMNTTKIWVQVHQLPFGFMDTAISALVGSHIC